MWCIAGTLPDPDFALCPAGLEGESTVAGGLLHLPDGQAVPVQRGTAALAATAEKHGDIASATLLTELHRSAAQSGRE